MPQPIKRPLHVVWNGPFTVKIYRERGHNGEVLWQCIGGVKQGTPERVLEYIDEAKAKHGREVSGHQSIPDHVRVV